MPTTGEMPWEISFNQRVACGTYETIADLVRVRVRVRVRANPNTTPDSDETVADLVRV